MFNETYHLGDSTPYTGPTYDPNSPLGFPVETGGVKCAPGTTATDVGGDYLVCLTAEEQAAFDQSSAVNITPKKEDSWTNWVIYGGLALVAIFAIGGRR